MKSIKTQEIIQLFYELCHFPLVLVLGFWNREKLMAEPLYKYENEGKRGTRVSCVAPASFRRTFESPVWVAGACWWSRFAVKGDER